MKQGIAAVLIALLALIGLACGGTNPTVTPESIATTALTVTAAPTATSTPVPTATSIPTPTRVPTPNPTMTPIPTATPTPTPQALTPAQIFSCVSPSIAFIQTLVGNGSGTLINGGYVVTNAHVVWPFESARIVFPDGTEYLNTPVANWDLLGDLAVLGPLDSAIEPLELVDGEDLIIGSDVFLIGYPAEAEEFPKPAITRGILSRLRQWKSQEMTYLQTDAAIADGQSGGVLVSGRGDVIGISGFKLSEAQFGVVASAADVFPRVNLLLTGRYVSGLGSRLIPLEGGQRHHVFDLDSRWGGQTFVINEPVGTNVTVEVRSNKDAGFYIVDIFGNLLTYVDETYGVFESASVVIELDAPHFLVVGQILDEETSFSVSSNQNLLLFQDRDDSTIVSVGKTVPASIDRPKDVDAFSIWLSEGDVIEATVDTVNFDPFAQVAFVGAADDEIAFDDNSGGGVFGTDSTVTYQAPHTGNYYIIVQDVNGTQVGGYLLSVSEAAEGAALSVTRPATESTVTEGFNFASLPTVTARDITAEYAHLADIAVPSENVRIELAPSGTQAFALDFTGTLTIIDLATQQVEASVALSFRPTMIVFDQYGDYAYLGGGNDEGPGAIAKFDLGTNSVVKVIPMESSFNTFDAAFSLAGDKLYVGNPNDQFITVVDPVEFEIINRIPLNEGGSFGLGMGSDGTRLYVTHAFASSMSVIETSKDVVVAVVSDVALLPVDILVSSDGNRAFIADNGALNVTVLDISVLPPKVVGNINTNVSNDYLIDPSAQFRGFTLLALTGGGSRLLVRNGDLPFVVVSDTVELIATSYIQVAEATFGVAVDATGEVMVLTQEGVKSVTFLGASPGTVAANPPSTPTPDPAQLQDAQVHFDAGLKLREQENFEEAIAEYDQAIQLYPKFPEAYNNRGAIFFHLGQFERAVEDFDAALGLDEQYPGAYNNRGVAYTRLGEFDRAIQDYTKAILYAPHYAEAYHNRGTAYYNQGELELALKDLRDAITLDPKLAIAYAGRALTLTQLERDGEAQQDVEQAVELGVDRTTLEALVGEIISQR